MLPGRRPDGSTWKTNFDEVDEMLGFGSGTNQVRQFNVRYSAEGASVESEENGGSITWPRI